MKIENIKIKLFVTVWKTATRGTDGKFNPTAQRLFAKLLKPVLKTKYYNFVYDKKDNLIITIFDNEQQRHDWLVEWFETHGIDGYSGKGNYKDFKKHLLDDIETPCCYSVLENADGVEVKLF